MLLRIWICLCYEWPNESESLTLTALKWHIGVIYPGRLFRSSRLVATGLLLSCWWDLWTGKENTLLTLNSIFLFAFSDNRVGSDLFFPPVWPLTQKHFWKVTLFQWVCFFWGGGVVVLMNRVSGSFVLSSHCRILSLSMLPLKKEEERWWGFHLCFQFIYSCEWKKVLKEVSRCFNRLSLT